MVSMEEAARQTSEMRKEKQEAIKEFISKDMTLLFEIAKGAGIDPSEAPYILNNPAAPISDVFGLYNSMESLKSMGKADAVSEIILNTKTQMENIIDYKKEIEEFKKGNPLMMFKIAAEAGMDAQEALRVLETGSKSELALLYVAMQIVKNAEGIKSVDEMVEDAKRM